MVGAKIMSVQVGGSGNQIRERQTMRIPVLLSFLAASMLLGCAGHTPLSGDSSPARRIPAAASASHEAEQPVPAHSRAASAVLASIAIERVTGQKEGPASVASGTFRAD